MKRITVIYAILATVCVGGTLILFAAGSKMQLASSAFEYGDMIPKQYTCDAGFGLDESPPLTISGVSIRAKSLVLIFEDRESETGLYIHWIVFNLPPTTTQIPGAADVTKLGGILGKNSESKIGYNGPCPGLNQQAYYFRLYALDTMLSLEQGSTKEMVVEAMKGHIIAETDLLGRYQRAHTEVERAEFS